METPGVQTNDPPVKIVNVIKLSGMFISLIIGASFSTGQSSIQFFISHGSMAVISFIIAYSIMFFMVTYLLLLGHDHKFSNPVESFKYFLGDKLGNMFTTYTMVVMLLTYTAMVAGAAATIKQFFGAPLWFGATLMIFTAVITVILGLKRMVNILGSVGPILSLMVIGIVVVAIFKNYSGFKAGVEMAPTLDILKISSSPMLSGLLYCCMIIPGILAILPPVGNSVKNRKEVTLGGLLGTGLMGVTDMLVVAALFIYVTSVYDKMIPMLTLTTIVLPLVAPVYMVLVLLAIFSTATPSLWGVCARYAEDGSKKYKLLAILLGLGAGYGSLILPFNKLVNVVYPTIGYSGILLLAAIIIKIVRTKTA